MKPEATKPLKVNALQMTMLRRLAEQSEPVYPCQVRGEISTAIALERRKLARLHVTNALESYKVSITDEGRKLVEGDPQ